MQTTKLLGLISALGLTIAGAEASLIKADGAEASSEFSSAYVAENTINGTGLEADFDENSIHNTYFRDNHWTTSSVGGAGQPGPVDEFITWTFNDSQSLSGMWVWNHLSNNIAANGGYEPVLVNIRADDASDLMVFSLENVALLPQESLSEFGASQLIDFGQTWDGIAAITLTILATQSSASFTGLAEVAFTDADLGAPVPVPGAALLLGTGLIAGRVLRKKRRA